MCSYFKLQPSVTLTCGCCRCRNSLGYKDLNMKRGRRRVDPAYAGGSLRPSACPLCSDVVQVLFYKIPILFHSPSSVNLQGAEQIKTTFHKWTNYQPADKWQLCLQGTSRLEGQSSNINIPILKHSQWLFIPVVKEPLIKMACIHFISSFHK